MGVPYAEVIGDPIAHSKSPAIHKFWLEQLGIEGGYSATRVGIRELGAFLAGRRADPNWRGCNVSMPLKTQIADEIDDMTSGAERAGAVNCVTVSNRRLIGTNTDMTGIDATLGRVLSHQRACVIGAGGAARATVAALAFKSVRDIRIVARRPGLAQDDFPMALEPPKIFSFAQTAQAMKSVEIVVNATPLGMTRQPPMPKAVLESLERAHPDAFVLDLVYAPLETALLKRARALGHGAADGLAVLIGQAREAFRLFFGAAAPQVHDGELRALLTR